MARRARNNRPKANNSSTEVPALERLAGLQDEFAGLLRDGDTALEKGLVAPNNKSVSGIEVPETVLYRMRRLLTAYSGNEISQDTCLEQLLHVMQSVENAPAPTLAVDHVIDPETGLRFPPQPTRQWRERKVWGE